MGIISQDPIGFAAGDANLYRYVANGPTKYADASGLDDNEPKRETGHRSGNNPEKHSAAERARRLQQQNALRRKAQESKNAVVNDAFSHIDASIDDLKDCRKTAERKMLRDSARASEYAAEMKKYDEAIARLQEIEIVVRDGEIVNVHNLDDLPDSALAVLTKKGRWIVRAGGKLLIPLGAIAAASAANQGYAGEGRFKDGGAVGAYVEVTADLMCADLVESGVHGWVNSVKRVFSLGTGPSLTERRLREALDARPQQGGSRVNE